MDETILQIVLKARDEATATINNAAKSFSGLSENAKKGAGIVAGAATVAGVAVIGMGAYSIKAASDFQQSMNLIQTNAGASAKEVQSMSKAVLDMATSVGTAPNELAQGLYHIESAGFRGAQALDILKASAEGAKVGNANLEDTTQALISLTASHIGGITSETQAMGTLNAIVGSGDMRMEALAQAMSTGIAPAFAAFGLNVKDMGAALATLTDNAVPPIDAATRLRMTVSMMGAPSTAATKALKGVGMSATQMATDMRSGGLFKALEDLQGHLKNLSKPDQQIALARIFGGGRQSATILTLLGQMDRLKSKYTDISEGAGKFGSAWDKTQQNASMAFAKLGASLQVLAVRFGTMLLPYVTKFANFLANNLIPAIDNTTKFFAKHKDALIAVAVVFGGLLTAALVAFGIVLWSSVILPLVAFLAIAWPFIAIGAAIAGVVALIVLHFKDIQNVLKIVGNFFKQVWTNILSVLKTVGAFVTAVFSPIFKLFFDYININLIILKDVFLLTWNLIKIALTVVGNWLKVTFGPMVKVVFDLIKSWLTLEYNTWLYIWDSITGLLTTFGSWLISTFGPIFQTAFGIIDTALQALSDGWQKTWNGIKSFVVGIANDIMVIVKNMLNSVIGFINNIIDGANKVGSKIPGYSKISDIPKFEQGGYVPKTGLAIVHQGEFVLSRAMLAGQAGIPNQVMQSSMTTNNNTPINIYATVNTDMDLGFLANRIAFAVRNSR